MGKLPVLQDHERMIPDTDRIRRYLEERHAAQFDPQLVPAQRAGARTVVRMLEEHLYFAILAERWTDPKTWPIFRDAVFGATPRPVRRAIAGVARRQVIGQIQAQGMGRFRPAERRARAAQDLTALREVLDDSAFLFGDMPTSADATAVPMLAAALALPGSELGEMVRRHPALVDYVDRGRAAIYPEGYR